MIEPLDTKAQKGDSVYLKRDGGKHKLREKFIVLEADQDTVKLAKLLNSLDRNINTKLSSKTINVKQTEVFQCNPKTNNNYVFENDAEDMIVNDLKIGEENPSPTWSVFSSSPMRLHHTDRHDWKPILNTAESSGSENSSDEATTMIAGNAEDDRVTIDDSDPDVRDLIDEGADDDHDHDVTGLQPHIEDQHDDSLDIQTHSDITITETAESIEEDKDEETVYVYDWNRPNPTELPEQGDHIEYLDNKNVPPVIKRAVVTKMYRTVQLKHPGWINIINEGAYKQSSIKINDFKWRILDEANDHKGDSTHSIDDKQEVTETHEVAFHEEVPLHNHLSMPFNDVQNLENILPLTSTPASTHAPAAHFPQRTSSVRPRGFLPMEFEDSPLGSPSKPPSRYKKALAEKAKKIQKAFSKYTADDDSSESN